MIEEKSERLIRDAETAKARIYEVVGKTVEQPSICQDNKGEQPMISALIDENYKLVGSHIEESVRQKILNNEFVDFARLLPKTKTILNEQDQRLQLYSKGGEITVGPVLDRNNSINSYLRWEQVFRVFSDVYTTKYPMRAPELIQYNHIIHTASISIVWENVYLYDIEFRLHMSKNPLQNWGIILQQAYTMFLKDRQNPGALYAYGKEGTSNSQKNKKLCYSFNKGKCKFGTRCKFDHRCGMCNKFGHGAFNCRKSGGIRFGDREGMDKGDQDTETRETRKN